MAGVKVQDQRMFSDVHSFLENVMSDLSKVKDTLTMNERGHQEVIDGVRKELDKERFDARESTNKFRYEFDELVHKRVETVLEGLEEMEQNQKYKDRQQQLQLDGIEEELECLKTNLKAVSATWGSFRKHNEERTPLFKGSSKGGGPVVGSRSTVRTNRSNCRKGNALAEVKRLQVKKAAIHLFEIVESMRLRVKGAAQFIHGENWAKVIRNVDKDGSGQIDFKEFKHMNLHLLRVKETEANLRIVFESLDEDHSGEISIEELVEFVSDPVQRMKRRLKAAVHRRAEKVGDEALSWEELLQEQDADGSGQLGYTEFKVMCRQTLQLLDKDVHLRQVFRSLDEDNSGEISVAEFIDWVNLEPCHFPITPCPRRSLGT